MMWLAGRWLRRITSVLSLVANAMVALMMLHIAFEVMMRSVFGISVPGTLALVSKYYLPAVVFLPLAMAERRDNHISVEVLTQLMSSRVQRLLALFAWLLGAVVFATLAYQTLLDAVEKFEIGAFELDAGYRFDTWPSYYLLPIGFATVTLVLLYKAAVTVFRTADGFGVSSGPDAAEPKH